MDNSQRKAQLLQACLDWIPVDPAYAVTAAAWYERNEPWLLENLERKVRRAVRASKSQSAPSADSTPESTTSPGQGA